MNSILFSAPFLLALGLCVLANILDVSMDKYKTHAFMKHPNHPKMGILCQIMLLLSCFFWLISALDVPEDTVTGSVLVIRLIIIIVSTLIARLVTSVSWICHALYFRWHILG